MSKKIQETNYFLEVDNRFVRAFSHDSKRTC